MENMQMGMEKKPEQGSVITIDPHRRQLIGIKTAPVVYQAMSLSIRAFGNVTYNEKELVDVSLRIKGWIADLSANFEGKWVQQGEPLFTIYSPDLYAAQLEYLQTLKTYSERVESLLNAAKDRLRLWGMTEEQINTLSREKQAKERVSILSPASGYIIEKNIVEGDFIEMGAKIYRLAPIDKVWIKAEIYQSDLLQIQLGTPVKITLPYLPAKVIDGTVSYVYPYLHGNARTGQVLIQLDNPLSELRAEMYATAEMHIDLGQRLQIPASALIFTGKQYFVFLDLGEGRLQPKEIAVGLNSNGYYEVIHGLSQGEIVVTSGTFLIAAESGILSAIRDWGADNEKK